MKKLTVILVAALIIISLASCGRKQKEKAESTTEAASVADETTTTRTAEEQSEYYSSVVNEEAKEMTKEEIVELYNTSVNRVKSEAKQITRNYSKVSCPDDMVELPSGIESIGKSAMKTFVKGSDEPQVWTSDEDMKAGFPVQNETYSSKLTADMVETATIKDNGKTYRVELKLYDDKITSPQKGQGYAGVFNTVSASTFDDISIPTVTFNKVDINGINGSISATIDKTSGKVTEIVFRNTDVMKLNVKVAFSTFECKIGLKNENSYSIKY